jgi:hypothetical protein
MSTFDLMAEPLSFGSPAYLIRNTVVDSGYAPESWGELSDGAYVAAMTGSEWFTNTGLLIPDDATEADILVAMKASRTLHQSDAWVRGDLIEWVRKNKFHGGDIPREELEKIANELGVASVKRLLNNATTARSWPIEYRHPAFELTYSHHEALNALPLAEKQAWAERAIAEGMSINALRDAIKNDRVSITQDGEATDVSFASEKLNHRVVRGVIARAISADAARIAQTNGTEITESIVRAAASTVLLAYERALMIKYPAKPWLDALRAVAAEDAEGAEGAEEGGEDA